MFGYVRPLKCELKVREYEQFKTAYCGLCNTLKKRYGFLSRFLLNYDFTFLAMLLSSGEASCEFAHRRCIVSPFKKKCLCKPTPSFELCADLSLILFYWKLRDNLKDEGLWERLKAHAILLLLAPAFRKARRNAPDFDERVSRNLAELQTLEENDSLSIDETSDKFALILAAVSEKAESEVNKRVLYQILYHIGRQVYILDAVDDLERDAKKGNYNAVAMRFSIKDGKLSEEIKKELQTTLSHSANMAASAFELLGRGMWTSILANIIYLGIPRISAEVLAGTWNKKKT
ncbi:MAG TPA: hypothetical protein GXZ65_03995 [Clostridiales bacterium]|jgi:hypothetical protein|nr:hypothetical protein [Clostridiales bacterium]